MANFYYSKTQISDQKRHLELLETQKCQFEKDLEMTRKDLEEKTEVIERQGTNLEAKENTLKDLESQVSSHEGSILELQKAVKSVTYEKSQAEEKICKIQSLWETEKAAEAEKLSDLAKAKELLLNSKVELQRQLEECQSDLQQLRAIQHSAKEELAATLKKHSKEMADLQEAQVCYRLREARPLSILALSTL